MEDEELGMVDIIINHLTMSEIYQLICKDDCIDFEVFKMLYIDESIHYENTHGNEKFEDFFNQALALYNNKIT